MEEQNLNTDTEASEPNEDTVNMIDDYELLEGIPEEEKKAWKEKYGTIFQIWFLGEQYLYRNFDYAEYKSMREKMKETFGDNVEAADEAFRTMIQDTCVIWPKDFTARRDTGKPKMIPGGIPFLISDYILAASGFAESIVPQVISSEARPIN